MNIATGVFDDIDPAERAIRALLAAGFTDDNIGVIARDTTKGPKIADDLGRGYIGADQPAREPLTSRTDVYSTLPTSFHPDIEQGGLPDDAMNWYNRHLDDGHVLVIVNTGDRLDDAVRILREHGATFYGDRMGRHEAMTTEHREAMPTERREAMTAETREIHVPIVDEQVTVEKHEREVGEVRITPERTQHTVEVPTTITHEEIRVERRTLARAMSPDEYQGVKMEKGEIRIPVVEEEVRVTKIPVIREELVIMRTPEVERRTLHETVMHEEPHVETTGDVVVERPEGEQKRRPAA